MTIQVIIADDHAITLEGFKTIIKKHSTDIVVVGEATNGKELLEMSQAKKADVYILDISMPVVNGIEAAADIRSRNPNAKIIMLSMHNDESIVEKAFKAGAMGYVLKENGADEIVKAIYEVYAGKYYVSPELFGFMVKNMMEKNMPSDAAGEGEKLTDREKEILKLIALGLSGKEIALKLGISQNTEHAHRNSIMRKLNIHKQTELVLHAVKEGLIEPNI